jgi:hypothetical protein
MFAFIATPRFATGYTPLRNRIGLLIEAHSLKDYRSRVRGTYDLVKNMIGEIVRSRISLIEANRIADKEAAHRGASSKTGYKFPLALRISRDAGKYDFKGFGIRYEDSAVSGAKRLIYESEPLDVTIPFYDGADVTKSVVPPAYYIIPPQWVEVTERLSYHGIKFERLPEDRSIEVESYTFEEPKWAAAPFEGRITLSAKSVPYKEKRMYPKGSVVIPVDQTASAVAIHLLEPDGPDSLFYWGFFNSIFERKEYAEAYALEKLAADMLKADPQLKAEFEAKLMDEKFASNARARLNFFYERSQYRERTGVYPVGRILTERY